MGTLSVYYAVCERKRESLNAKLYDCEQVCIISNQVTANVKVCVSAASHRPWQPWQCVVHFI